MERKSFLKVSGLGLGLTFISGMNQSHAIGLKDSNSKKIAPKIVNDDEGAVLNVIGDIQTHKLTGSDTGNQVMEWVDNVDPGAGIPPHVHTREDEIFRVIKGQVEIMVNGETTILSEGDVAFAPKNLPHSWKVVGNQKAKMITTAFPAGIELMFQELAELPAGPPDFEKVTKICAQYGIRFV